MFRFLLSGSCSDFKFPVIPHYYTRVSQPHFISTVVMCGIIVIFLQPNTGIFNIIRSFFGLESISFLSKPALFKTIYVFSDVWQGLGWSSIIYISALSGVDYQMHEAAMIDGAGKLKRIWHIDLPSILPTVVMLFILQVGGIMNVGFEKVFLLQNPLNMTASDVISTYVYRMGLCCVSILLFKNIL